jgi:histidine triad (HIT) family protein
VNDCPFCSIVRNEAGESTVVHRDGATTAFLDRSPVFKGHVLVVPNEHVVTLADVSDIASLFATVQRIASVMPSALDAHGTWIAMNNIVSQSVPHAHVHVVPRRRKDGLRGFFWPRVKYTDDVEAAEYARSLRSALRE